MEYSMHFRKLALVILLLTQGAIAQDFSGTVRDARDGHALPSANIILLPDGRGMATDARGEFLFRNIPRGDYTVRVSFVGYRTEERAVTIADAAVRMDIRLQPAALPGPTIEVSAMKARERFSPVTFADVRREQLEREYFVQDVPVLLSDLPAITFYSEGGNGIGYNYLRIRGFDQRRLSVMVNGVPQNDPEDHNIYWINLVDMLGNTEEIQVQRGAGSAFYGPPAIGGSINIITGDFATKRGVTINTGAGSYNTQRYALSMASGLIDNTWALYGRLSRMSTDGYRDNAWVKASSYYLAATRYDGTVTTRINVYGGPLEDGLAYTGLPKSVIKDRDARRKNFNYWETDENGAYTYTQPRRPQEQESFSQPHYELLNEWRIDDAWTFNNVLFYVVGQGYFDYDGSGWTDAGYFRMTPEFGFDPAVDPLNPIIRAYVDNRQVGMLPRVTWKHGAGALTAGLELRRHRSLHWGRVQWAGNLPADMDPDRQYYSYRGGKDIGAVYVQELLPLTEDVNLMGNVQYVFNRYHLYDERFIGTALTQDYHFVNPRLGVNWNLTPAWNLYGNLSYTSREPRLKNLYDAAESSGGATPQYERNADGSFDFDRPLVRPERLLNVEIGAGYVAGPFKLLLNAYAMDFRDEIVKSGQLDRFGQPVTGNADRTRHLGVEFSGQWHILPSLALDVNGLLSRSRLESYTVFDEVEGQVRPVSLDGNRIAGFPERLANVKLSWQHGGFTSAAVWKFVGEQYTDNTENEQRKVDAYGVMNLSVGYRLPAIFGLRALELRCSVNNLFDTLYAQSGEGLEYFVGAERNVFADLTFEL